MSHEPNSSRVVLAALVANFVITLAKVAAFLITGSKAMLAECFHSVADTGNQLLMLIGIHRSRLPADQTHPYGYGKESYFWSFVVAVSIFVIGGIAALSEGISGVYATLRGEGHLSTNVGWAIGVLSISILIEGASFGVALKEVRKALGETSFSLHLRETRCATLLTVLFEDAAAVLGLTIALAGVTLAAWTGNPIFDAAASILIGVLLLIVATYLAYKTHQLLIGQSAPSRVEEELRSIIENTPGVNGLVEMQTLHMGPDYILLNVGIQFRRNLVTLELEKIIDEIERKVKTHVPQVKRIFIEADSLTSLVSISDSDDSE